METKDCSIDSCSRSAIVRGFCELHYRRWLKYGDPHFVKRTIIRGSVEKRFWAKVHKTEGCWLRTARQERRGYGSFMMDRGSAKWRPVGAHRVAWELTNGPIPDGLCVLHRCDNPSCVRPEHLYLGTNLVNSQDMVSKGRQACGDRSGKTVHPERTARGERNGSAKLTENDVKDIRTRFANGGITKVSLALEYGVRDALISKIIKRQVWTHL
jgi:hypothetical protein